MTITNYGNGYKFKAIMARRSGKPKTVTMQRLRKDGTWGKPTEEKVFGNETPQDVLERLSYYNPSMTFRLVEKPETTTAVSTSPNTGKAGSEEKQGKTNKKSKKIQGNSIYFINP